jgi:hypothetical protein
LQAPQSRPAPHAAAVADRLQPALAHEPRELLARLAPTRAQERRLLGGARALDLQQLLDDRLARAAARARARDRHDLLRRAQPALTDRRDDLALADPVAVADLRTVRELGGGGLRRAREQLERIGGALAGANLVDEQLGAARVAEQDRAEHLAAGRRDELAVRAGGGVGNDDLALALGRAGRDELDAHHVELRRGDRAPIARSRPRRDERPGADARLVVDRRDDPVHDAVVLCALADGEHAGVGAHEPIVDDDAAVDGDARGAREVDVRADADGDHDEVARELRAVGEGQAADRAVAVGEHRARGVLEADVDAERLDRRGKHGRRRRVELALHEPVDEVHHGRRAPALGQRVRGLEAKEPATDDRGVARAPGVREDRRAVGRVAEDMHARRARAVERRDERIGARAEHGAVEAQRRVAGELRRAGVGVERRDAGVGEDP